MLKEKGGFSKKIIIYSIFILIAIFLILLYFLPKEKKEFFDISSIDTSACDVLTSTYAFSMCYIDLAILNSEIKICEGIQIKGNEKGWTLGNYEVDSCKYGYLSNKSADSKDCDQINNSLTKQYCVMATTINTLDASKCLDRAKDGGISPNNINECLFGIAMRKGDPNICFQKDSCSDEEMKELCSQRRKRFGETCDEKVMKEYCLRAAEVERIKCLHAYAITKKDSQVCDLISEVQSKDACKEAIIFNSR